MSTHVQEKTDAILPTLTETEIAKASSQQLAHLLGGLRLKEAKSHSSGPVKIEIRLDGEHEVVSLPSSALDFLNEILTQMAQGRSISILPQHCVLTTVQASEVLNVSRPYLINLLENGAIPFHKVGTHRRVLLEDVMQYKHEIDKRRLATLQELSELSEELGMDD